MQVPDYQFALPVPQYKLVNTVYAQLKTLQIYKYLQVWISQANREGWITGLEVSENCFFRNVFYFSSGIYPV